MSRFSLNPLDTKNLKSAILVTIFFAFLFFFAWLADHIGNWVLWIPVFVIFGGMARQYEINEQKQRRISEAHWKRAARKKPGYSKSKVSFPKRKTD